MPTIHPTAVVDRTAVLADDVEIGPWCVVESDVTLGPGCVLRPNAIVRQYTTMGANNLVDSFTVIGGLPQDLKFDPRTATHVRVGNNNVFREGCTISRATTPGGATVVGSNTYWMTGAHVGHDSLVEDHVILVNHVALAGHATVRRGAVLSQNTGVHQFCWVGEMVMTRGHSGISTHMPPFVTCAETNVVVGLNVVGLRRAGVPAEQRRQVKEAFDLLFRRRLPTPRALNEMDKCTDWTGPAVRFRDFVRDVLHAKKPFNRPLPRLRNSGIAAEE
ncbi:MAG: acyl-ACP--UDP-N-acetylglucosamine O-acyltransferase [Phycisphaerae bacterium]|nr:acyl-ACP--UDP-N-acetylglucosamine O-acyltransferase [Phycisphaerae bacterium]